MNAAVGLHPLGAARRSTARWQPVSSQVLNIILSLLDLLRVHCFMGRSGETYGNPAATRNGHASRWSNLRQLNGFGRFERKLEPWQLIYVLVNIPGRALQHSSLWRWGRQR